MHNKNGNELGHQQDGPQRERNMAQQGGSHRSGQQDQQGDQQGRQSARQAGRQSGQDSRQQRRDRSDN